METTKDPSDRRYLRVLTIVTFTGFFFAAFDTIVPIVSLPVILKDLHLSLAVGGLVVSAGFLGTFLTGLVIGPVMDRWGRKSSFRIVLLGTAIFSALNAFIMAAWQFAVIRFLAGSSLGTIETAGVLVSEEAPARWRGLLVGIVQAAFPCGSIAATAVAAMLLPHDEWRPLFFIAFIPAIVVVWIAGPLLRESPRFTDVLRAKRGDVVRTPETAFEVDFDKARQSEWRQIFARDLRRQTVVASLFALLVNCGVGFVVALGVTYLTVFDHLPIGLAALALLLESVGTLVGQIGSGVLADYFPARNVLVVFALLGAVSVYLLSVPGPFGWVVVPMIGAGVFGQGILGCLPRYASDSFPTRARGTGASAVLGAYWIGVIFMPAVYGAMMGSGEVAAVPLVAAIFMVAGGVVLLFARSIAPRRELEQIAI